MQLPKPTEGGSFELAPAGSFIARCYRFLDLGTHKNDYQGESKTRREVMLSWELSDEMMSDGRPFSVSKTYTWSMHEKATLRSHLEAWRGKAFEDADFEGPTAFNTKKLIGQPCLVNIKHETRGDKVYANLASIGKMIKGAEVKGLVNQPTYLSLDQEGWDATVYASLSDRLKAKIAESPEYKDLMSANRKSDDPGAHVSYLDDDLPF